MNYLRLPSKGLLVLVLILFLSAQNAAAILPSGTPTPAPYNQRIADFHAFSQSVGGGAAQAKVGLSLGKSTQASALTLDVNDSAGGAPAAMMRISVDAAGNCTVSPPFNKVFTVARCWRELQQSAYHIAANSTQVVSDINILLTAITDGANTWDPPIVTG